MGLVSGEPRTLQGEDREVHAKALDDHECDDSEWHFVITRVKLPKLAPREIHVEWANNATLDVVLSGVTGNVAHYTTTANLDSPVTDAWTRIYEEWDGQFNLSHGPCDLEGGYGEGEDGQVEDGAETEPTDADGDGVPDGEDNCPDTANGDQEDLDGDGTGDACDSDRDGDGVADDQDAFPDDPDEWEDTDGDGVLDGDDAFPNDPDADSDADGDGVPDSEDNCPEVANPGQEDLDGDGIGDACDGDRDGDGLTDEEESDGCSDPTDADSDDDGLLDGAEVDDHGTDPCQADTDGCGTPDGDEVAAGTDPLDGSDDVDLLIVMEKEYEAMGDVNGTVHLTRAGGDAIGGELVTVEATYVFPEPVEGMAGDEARRPAPDVFSAETTCITDAQGRCEFTLPRTVVPGGLGLANLVTIGHEALFSDHLGRWHVTASADPTDACAAHDTTVYFVRPVHGVDAP